VVLVVAIFAINVYLARPVLDSFLFSLALAVGLTPQLLPAIISINLSHGAKRMAEKKVIVKRLASIENFGSMNVLCSDKTGTLTEGIVHVQSACNMEGTPNEKSFFMLISMLFMKQDLQTQSMKQSAPTASLIYPVTKSRTKFRMIFFVSDLSILVSHDNTQLMVTKGRTTECACRFAHP